jgi:hypothetical protein
MQLDKVVPWGRSLGEYIDMFALTPADLESRILDCGGGPSSFTAELSRENPAVISCDPLYQFTTEQIRGQIDATYPRMLALNEAHKANFRWDRYGSPEALCGVRMAAMSRFLDDYDTGKAEGRYVLGELPTLPFVDDAFDLALCSHFLFTYSEQLTLDLHIASVLEMLRVAREVRVFPLLTSFTGETSPHLAPVRNKLQEESIYTEICRVKYEFQHGGNEMLIARRTPNGSESHPVSLV